MEINRWGLTYNPIQTGHSHLRQLKKASPNSHVCTQTHKCTHTLTHKRVDTCAFVAEWTHAVADCACERVNMHASPLHIASASLMCHTDAHCFVLFIAQHWPDTWDEIIISWGFNKNDIHNYQQKNGDTVVEQNQQHWGILNVLWHFTTFLCLNSI